MGRRDGGRGGRRTTSSLKVLDSAAAIVLGAVSEWVAADAVVVGTVTSVPNRVGGGPALTPTGTPAAPVVTAQLGGRPSLLGRYSAALTLTTPAGVTVAMAGYESTSSVSALIALTAGGVVNSGQSAFRSADAVTARGGANDVSVASADPIAAVWISRNVVGGPNTIRQSALTATVGTGTAASLATTNKVWISSLDDGGTFHSATLRWARVAVFDRALTDAEASFLMLSWGQVYMLPIAP